MWSLQLKHWLSGNITLTHSMMGAVVPETQDIYIQTYITNGVLWVLMGQRVKCSCEAAAGAERDSPEECWWNKDKDNDWNLNHCFVIDESAADDYLFIRSEGSHREAFFFQLTSELHWKMINWYHSRYVSINKGLWLSCVTSAELCVLDVVVVVTFIYWGKVIWTPVSPAGCWAAAVLSNGSLAILTVPKHIAETTLGT